MRLEKKIALVTGAAGSIGSAVARRFAREGATTIISDINSAGSDKVLKEIQKAGGSGAVILADVLSEADIVGLFEQVKNKYGRLDIIATIAGTDVETDTSVDEISYDKMCLNIDVSLKSCILCCREAAKIMIPQNYGRIVNMSSIVYRGSPMQFTYSAAKGGIAAFTRSMAMALGMYSITVNALAPSLVEVDIIKNTIGLEMWEALKQDCSSRYPLGRVGQPEDVANCALFLASDEASFITGQIIEISGGARL
jgi:NAD(P)-dependent dehydrogenase (short-subunit alcohol dehydrogenase family)